jgi:hypothetical protein
MTSRQTPQPPSMSIEDIVAPLGFSDFVANYWNSQFCRLSGPAGRFSSLIGWPTLSAILEQDFLAPPRLKLIQNGRGVPPERYLAPLRSGTQLFAEGLLACLSEGATLVIDSIDRLAPPIGAVAESFEQALRSTTTVNLYASWPRGSGFNLHWDNQDMMILQASGRKYWKVYAPTYPFPLHRGNAVHRPVGDPVWQGVLEDGAVLYLPRGWWHVAEPLDEPSLHLTITMVPARGIDVLQWILERARSHLEVRMDVPRLADAETQRAYTAKLREAFLETLDDQALAAFFQQLDSRAPARPKLQFPLGVERQPSSVSANED